MHITVKRVWFNENNVVGRMYVNDIFFAYTLEDKYRLLNSPEDKVKNHTAIPYGQYKVTVTPSNRFKRDLPLLHNVPYFEAIRIHGGNTEADSEGCILIGGNTDEKKIWNCKSKVDELTRLIKEAGTAIITIQPMVELA